MILLSFPPPVTMVPSFRVQMSKTGPSWALWMVRTIRFEFWCQTMMLPFESPVNSSPTSLNATHRMYFGFSCF